MKITRVSTITGAVHAKEINVTNEQLIEWQRGDKLIQDVMPSISADDREFIMSGITPTEWNDYVRESA